MSAAVTPQPAGELSPIQLTERIQVVDVLRGWALFGILMVNMQFFSWPAAYLFSAHPWPNAWDNFADTAMRIFFEGKFYTLFSFLFGLGFSIQLMRAEAKGRGIAGFFSRRLFILLTIGVIHGTLIWFGDILAVYGVSGYFLLLFRNRKPKTIAIWAFVMLLIPSLIFGALTLKAQTDPKWKQGLAKQMAENDADVKKDEKISLIVYPGHDWKQLTKQRAKDWSGQFAFFPFVFCPVASMFLFGLYCGRTGVFRDLEGHRELFRTVFWLGVFFGLPLSVLAQQLGVGMTFLDMGTPRFLLVNLLASVSAPITGLFYASIFVMAFMNPAWQPRLRPLSYLGRMAMTNYLTHSVVLTTIFYGYGLGLYGKYPPGTLLLFVPVIWLLQIPISKWWLSRFQYGPMEWLWRSGTYMKLQPMRLKS